MRKLIISRKQPSYVILIFAAILINLCPFEPSQITNYKQESSFTLMIRKLFKFDASNNNSSMAKQDVIEQQKEFIKRHQIVRLLGEAKMLAKMAKIWFIKKKIKKLNKKLKKHTIAVPVITAIPIYEHSYYPPPHMSHLSHPSASLHHAAAASYYAPSYSAATHMGGGVAGSTGVSPLASGTSMGGAASAAASSLDPVVGAATKTHNQLAVYRYAQAQARAQAAAAAAAAAQQAAVANQLYQHPQAAAQQIINSYVPAPPIYYDETGGMYGHYGNAYGRYDGGYHLWRRK